MWLLQRSENRNEQIVDVLLALRDQNQRPVINLNQKDSNGDTVVAYLFKNAMPSQARRRLLQKLIDVRTPAGQPWLDLTKHEGVNPLLKLAVKESDEQCLGILLDIRNANGEAVLDINEIENGETILDAAKRESSTRIVQVIQQDGGLEAKEIDEVMRQDQRDRKQQLRKQHAEEREKKAIILKETTRDTHNQEVTITVKNSALALKNFYPDTDTATTLEAVHKHLEKLPEDDGRRITAMRCFDAVSSQSLLHAATDMTLSEALALVWVGAENRTHLPDGVSCIDDTYIALRKESLVDALHEAATTYPHLQNQQSCFVGTFNKIIEILNHAHRDVIVTIGEGAVLTDASESAPQFMHAHLKDLPIRAQRRILKTWDSGNNHANDSAIQYRRFMARYLDDRLARHFETLLTHEQRRGIVDNCQYLPRPVLHRGLDQCIDEIHFLEEMPHYPYRNARVQALKAQADDAYGSRDRSFDEEYTLLAQGLESLKSLDTVCCHFFSFTEDPNTFTDTLKRSRQHCITAMQEHTDTVYCEQSPEITTEKIASLQNTYSRENFDRLDKLVKNITLLCTSEHSGAIRKLLFMEAMKRTEDHAYGLNADQWPIAILNLNTIHDSLKNLDCVEKWSSSIRLSGNNTQCITLINRIEQLIINQLAYCNDKRVGLAAVSQYGRALEFASGVLPKDQGVALDAAHQDSNALQFATPEIRAQEFLRAVFAAEVPLSSSPSDELRTNRNFMLELVGQDGFALQYASEELRNDQAVVLAAVRQDNNSLQFATPALRAQQGFLSAVFTAGFRLSSSSSEELRADRELVLAAVHRHGYALRYASEELRADREVVVAAVRQNGRALQHASAALKADRGVVLATVHQDGWTLKYASEELRANKEVVLVAVSQFGSALQFASEALRADQEVVLAAVRQNVNALQFAPERLQADQGFVGALKDGGISSKKLYDNNFGFIASYSGVLTATGLAGVSVGGIGLALVSTCIVTGLTASLVFPASVALIALGSLLSLVAGSYYLRQRAPAVKKSISDTLNYFGLLRPHRQQSAQRDTSRVASFGASS